jgi:hypothetical protein
MSVTQVEYSLASEAFKSFLRSFPLSLIVDLLLWLIYLAFSTNLLHHRFSFLLNIDAWQVWKDEVARYAGFVPLTFIMFFLVGMIQFLAVCLPFAKWISKGLQVDAGRSWLFYVASGALMGGGPWILFVLTFANHTVEAFGANAIFVYPSLTAGLIAGAVLKYRLVKLAKHSGAI